jgi:allophanate hydrolase subunit 2
MGSRLRVLAGPEFEGFTAEARDVLFKASWKVSSQSNRMGYRLEGPTLARQDSGELSSHAVFPGVIQVPPGGTPIVLMADAQATGGYPRIACVIAADQWRLAQAAPGMSIQFEPCTRAAALSALHQQQDYLQRLQRSLREH